MSLLSIILSFLLASASGALSFDSVSHDFGRQPNSATALEHVFHFTNSGKRAVKISYAVSTCSCTVLDWSRETLSPGQGGFVRARYYKESNSNRFEKFISVFVEGESKPYVLRIAGSFFDTDNTLSSDFPVSRYPLGFSSSPIVYGESYVGAVASDSFYLANLSSSPVVVTFKDLSPGMTIIPEFRTVAAHSRESFSYLVQVDSLAWGKRLYSATPVADGVALEPVAVSVTAIEDFTSLSREQANNGPLPILVDRTCSFGTIHAGQTARSSFRIKNASDSVLHIRAVYSAHQGVSVDAPAAIPPRATATFNVAVAAPSLQKGSNNIKLCVQSDSPLMQIVEVYLTGTIE